jgi:hypothetical protein
MLVQNPLIAMKDVDVLVPDTEVEIALYAAFCHGLHELRELSLDQRPALAAALAAASSRLTAARRAISARTADPPTNRSIRRLRPRLRGRAALETVRQPSRLRRRCCDCKLRHVNGLRLRPRACTTTRPAM